MFRTHRRLAAAPIAALAVAATTALTAPAAAQEVTAEFAADYTLADLGAIPGVPTPYGGLVFSADDPNVLLIGGAANSGGAAIYAIEVERGCDNGVIGFVGEATMFAEAPNIDGGLAYGPGGVLFFTQFPLNGIGQILPGSTVPARIDALGPLGVASSTGTLQFVPEGLPGAGSLKVLSYSASTWYDVELSDAGDGTWDVLSADLRASISGGPEGVVFIDGNNPGFDGPAAVVSQYAAQSIAAYDVGADGDAIPETARTMVTGLPGAEGATLDPMTGEFVFSTFGGGNRVIVVRGFLVPCPADVMPEDGGDGVVNFDDLLEVLASWGQACTGPDIDRSGEVDFDDVLAVLSAWGPC